MEADESRKYWASLLAGKSPLQEMVLGPWLGLADIALGGKSLFGASADVPESDESGRDAAGPASAFGDVLGWAQAMHPLLESWSASIDSFRGSAWSGVWPRVENPLARMLNHPAAVADNPSTRLVMEAGLALVDLLQGLVTHQALQSQGWMKAMQRFIAEFQHGDDAKAVVVTSLDDLASHWATVGEATLQEHSRSERFLQSQAAMLRKTMGYKLAKRRLVEAAARANDLPTLTDLDEAFATIHELRNELRGVRQLAEAAVSAAAAANPSAAIPHMKSRSTAGVRHSRVAA